MIDILLATYNGEKFIRDQIESILCQTYKDWNLIIQDDGSTDKTIGILKDYLEKYPEKIKIFLNKKNSGSCVKNFLSLAKRSRSQYVMFCDQDDVWLEDKIEITLKAMKELEKETQNKNIPLLVHTDLKIVDENLNVISNSIFRYQKMNPKRDRLNNFLVQNIVTGCTLMCNKKLIQVVDMIDLKTDARDIIMYDHWIGLVAAAFGKIKFLNKPTLLYRQHKKNQVGAKNAESLSYVLKNLFNFKQTSKIIDDTYIQAESFLNIYFKFLNSRNIKIIREYVNIKKYNKFKRLYIIIKYSFFKYGFLKKLGQVLILLFF